MSHEYVIIFHDKSRRFISRRTHDAIFEITGSGKEKFKLGDAIISASSIAQILSIADFNNQYPQERVPQYKNFGVPTVLIDGEEMKLLGDKKFDPATVSEKGLGQLIIGLERFMASAEYKGEKATKDLLESLKLKQQNYAKPIQQ
jgi:hypothetical protein